MKKPGLGKIASIIAVFCVANAVASPAQTYIPIGSFFESYGNAPQQLLVQGENGEFYGTTVGGGTGNCSDTWQFFTGCGTAFQMDPSTARITAIHIFCSEANCIDGALPMNILQATDGNLYGTTLFGGHYETGAFYKITPNSQLTTLHSFLNTSLGAGYVVDPNEVIQGRDGNFYGTTIGGGTGKGDISCDTYANCGTVFKITPAGELTTLYNFCTLPNCSDGLFPSGALVQAANGNFYGTTGAGYYNDPCTPSLPCGTIFEITPAGKLTTLHTFCTEATKCADGGTPTGGLVQAANGNLYGTTLNPGVVFEITPAGEFRKLHRFCNEAGCPDGEFPSSLSLGSDGNFYGTTQGGGANTNCSTGGLLSGCGTIFRITPTGELTTLYSFCSSDGCPDGYTPYAPPVQSTDGTFYGTTAYGGAGSCTNSHHYGTGCGVIYGLGMDLGPFAEARPGSGKSGAAIGILGNRLTGATSVTFNGASATFTVVSATFITAEVPAGATTGTIQVTTPSGTLNSNLPFQVLP